MADVRELPFGGSTPLFGGSTGGLLRSAQTEEKYLIVWNSKEEQVFEMPTGGAATMVAGTNVLYLARKEQCHALHRQLVANFKIRDSKIYRVFPDGEQVLIFPMDGVASEKSNPGREPVGYVPRKIGDNPNPVDVKFTGKGTYDV
ncbi:photosystem I reaction center subunit II [Gloeobacter kilaueensis]|uniref:Photosystem I reaction center subunit II n=1 Tax=Gloeobacter kilaueensis (strain ATCC BAA-2537 / CCAP 1431/1 / ULC 316 / JS1) TaxID=1183438 RepID=U5QGD8_GLOK1|nr:photosystem I reaction center subunit II PsaD [Gloeobacter kilaueensis]AGY56730.1 photosystem I protein PsaD [Gloeobacter kilaueensis JS1]